MANLVDFQGTSALDSPIARAVTDSILQGLEDPSVLDDQAVAFINTRNQENINRILDSAQDEFVELQASRGTLNSGDALNLARNVGAARSRQIAEGERDVSIRRAGLRAENLARLQGAATNLTSLGVTERGQNLPANLAESNLIANRPVEDFSGFLLDVETRKDLDEIIDEAEDEDEVNFAKMLKNVTGQGLGRLLFNAFVLPKAIDFFS